MVTLRGMSHKRFTDETRRLMDVVADPLAPVRTPIEYANAYRDLSTILLNEEIWSSVFEIRDGCKSNYALYNLGKERIEWLTRFKESLDS